MPGRSWSEAVASAVQRHVAKTDSRVFTRQALIDAQLDAIVADTGSAGATPHQTLSRELQQLRDSGVLEFIDQGTYRLVDQPMTGERPTKGVFVVGSHSIYDDEPERFYRFPQIKKYLPDASRMVGQWIVYQEPRRAGPRGYFAVAKVERIVPDPSTGGMYLAMILSGTYLEFGQDVPFRIDAQPVERGLLNDSGGLRGSKQDAIRPLSDEDFNRIVGFGLVEEDELLPREEDEAAVPALVQEEQAAWEPPVDRASMLVNRKVRNRQFRKRVLEVYDRRCALTGMQLINGGGRAEAQAAHIMSVEAGGPDVVANGIALSGTLHWMFDRGLISLSDAGDILLSTKINDIEGVQKLIYPDRRARFPAGASRRPHARYLGWHRDNCFYG